ncbi:MAG TPA: hypothetical protein VMV82_07645 [Candidatus Dormibacteraeota bacterium]|nr:hypothetical protein [Candidatus Dormibacteraeota bacterium]
MRCYAVENGMLATGSDPQAADPCELHNGSRRADPTTRLKPDKVGELTRRCAEGAPRAVVTHWARAAQPKT